MAKKAEGAKPPPAIVVAEEKGGVPAEMAMDAGTEIMKAEGQGEIQAAVVLAKRFPRDEEKAKVSLLAACDLEEFAGAGDSKKPGAYYSFPRGKTQDPETGEWKPNIVSGASVRMAREAARVWGNIRYGFFVTHDDDESRGIVAWAWDLEKNLRTSGSDFFKKLIQRKDKSGATHWITADERELRELTFRKSSILIRNCILQLLPGYFVDHAVMICKTTAAGGAGTDLKDRVVKMQRAFKDIGVSSEALEKYLGKPIIKCSRDDIADLRGIYQSMVDGMISPEERQQMFGVSTQPAEAERAQNNGEKRGGLTMDSVSAAKSQAEPHQEATGKAEKKSAKSKAVTGKTTTRTGSGEEKFDPKLSVLSLIRGATEENWAEIKATALKMVKEIKLSKDILDVSNAINERQKEILK